MHTRSFLLTLLDDCVFSESAATEGGHSGLSRVPGSALLGVAANRLYAKLGPSQAFEAFHSGRIRFGDGRPTLDGVHPAWPVPLCLHIAKDVSATEAIAGHKYLRADAVFNFLLTDKVNAGEEGAVQPKQLRDGYIGAHGQWIKPQQSSRLKTAVSADTGRAADAQLFGYQALARGQRFIATLEADRELDTDLFERICAVFDGPVLLGRSRSAEYGRVHAQPAPHAHTAPLAAPQGARLVIWLLSDFAPCDAAGQPTLELDPQTMRLPAGSRIAWDKTFLRTRRYSPWNAKRHGYDTERLIFTAGGVISIDLPANIDAEHAAQQFATGIGLHREAGLGQVCVQPRLLKNLHPAFEPPAPDPQPPLAASARVEHPLLQWLEAQSQRQSGNTHRHEAVIALVKQYESHIEAARRAHGHPLEATDFYPSTSQWGSVLEVAKFHDGVDLYGKLFHPDTGIIRAKIGSGWDLELPPDWTKLAVWLCKSLSENSSCDAKRVQELARRLMTQTRTTSR